jgi:cell division protease FtsH
MPRGRGVAVLTYVPTQRPAATPPSRHPWGLLVVFLLMTALWTWRSTGVSADATGVTYSTAIGWIRENRVESVVLEGAELTGKLRLPVPHDDQLISEFKTVAPADERLVPLLDEHGVAITAKTNETSLGMQILLSFLPWILIIGVFVWLTRRASKMTMAGGGPFGSFLKRGKRFDQNVSKTPNVTFEDVAGLAAAKRDLAEIALFLKEPHRFRKLGAKIPRGVLLLGPPGTGKTLLARAVAGEANVPFYSISASEFVEMFVGVGAARVRELFEEAKKNSPAIVFIDEIDAVGRARGTGLGGGHDEREQTLNQLLSEMDGFDRNDMIVVIAATNRPDVLDAALMRPGRFDRRVVVDLPEATARKAILGVHAKDKPLAKDVDFDALASMTAGFSGADLANLVNEAALGASRGGAERIARADFLTAYDKIVLGDPREGKLRTAEKTRVAVHESGHAVLAWASPEATGLRRVSILPRGMALGATQQVPPEDRHLHTRDELIARLRVLLGGYAAERLVLGDISTGAEHDLKEATRIAQKMVAHYGMSEKLGPAHYDVDAAHPFLGARVGADHSTSEATVHAIEAEARKLLSDALVVATDALVDQRERLDKLTSALLARETLESDDLNELLGPSPTPAEVVPIDAPIPPTHGAEA